MRLERSSLALLALVLPLLASAPRAAAQPVDDASPVGYELALQGMVATERGAQLQLHGVAYEVVGWGDLRASAGLALDVTLSASTADGRSRTTESQLSVRSEAGGRFSIAMPVPDRDMRAPQITIAVHRPGQPARTFQFGVHVMPSREIALLSDRERYEPGETIHAFALVRTVRERAPVAGRELRTALLDMRGQQLSESSARTDESGAITFDLEVPASAPTGVYRIQVTGEGVPNAIKQVQVFQRTVERLAVSVSLEQELLAPGQALRGAVRVSTPAGAPVRGARVLVFTSEDGEPIELVSDREGIARFDGRAPSFLSGDVARTIRVVARVEHESYGALTATAPYVVARARWLIETHPEAGGLVPEVDSQVFISVADPLGAPLPAGTELEVRGLGIAGGRTTVQSDAHGVAAVSVRLPRGAAARMRGGACAGRPSTSIEIEVRSRPVVVSPACVPVAPDANLLARVTSPVVAPGDTVEVELLRRPTIARAPILVELLFGGRSVAHAWAAAGAARVSLEAPADLQGLMRLRARPLTDASARAPLDEPGATTLDTGAFAQLVVRPRDAFALEVRPDAPLHRVRETAQIDLHASVPPQRAFAVLLARDEAAHGGEVDYRLEWIEGQMRAVLRGAWDSANERFLRAALSAELLPDPGPVAPAPLVTPPWGSHIRQGTSEGTIRDPLAMREEARRRGFAQIMRAMEHALAGADAAGRAGLVRQSGRSVDWEPDAIEHLVRTRRLSDSTARTLGGQRLTVAMLREIDPSFTFDAVARRIARERLVGLLVALSRFSDPDDEAAARASAGEGPERWLARVSQLGVVNADALLDPWGRPFVFRRVTGRRPTLVVSARALDWELSSAGPDGNPGNADDVRDPFARVVPEGTPYAVASGEDNLMRTFSRLAPGGPVLVAMSAAYHHVGLAATEERRGGLVTATATEAEMTPMAEPSATAPPPMPAEQAMGLGGLEMAGGSGRRARRAPSAGDSPDQDGDGVLDAMDDESGEFYARAETRADEGGAMATAAAVIREDFPATLRFISGLTLDAQGNARVPLELADALTTYRLEAIAWSTSGWITSGMGRVRVDQEAQVDAPVPETVLVGDEIRLPIRLSSRSTETLRVHFEIAAEGDLALDVASVEPLEVPPGDAMNSIALVRVTRAGQGALLITAIAEDGRELDAVRRPLRALTDSRLAREQREELIRGTQTLTLEVPAGAEDRGPGEVRLAVADSLFGDPAVWGAETGDAIWSAWALAMAGRELPEATRAELAAIFELPEGATEDYFRRWDQSMFAAALGASYRSDFVDDRVVAAAIRYLSLGLGPEDAEVAAERGYEERAFDPARTLLALAPALRAGRGVRAALREDLERLADRLRRLASAAGARATEAPATWVEVAAALALSHSDSASDARAAEMLRRADRHVVSVGDEAWLEPDQEDGSAEPRVIPTAHLALARIASGDRAGALPLLRNLAAIARNASRWDGRARALASAASALLTSGPGAAPTLTLDGAPLTTSDGGGVTRATLPALSPGAHRLVVTLPAGALALVSVELRLAFPWDVAPARESPLELTLEGPVGARETRAGLLLTVRNRGARVLTRPVVEIQLPSGAELDEPTREGLASHLASPPEIEGNVLRLHLRPMAPAGFLRLPLRARWSTGGTLRGLGASAWDDAQPVPLSVRAVRVLPSRALEIADRGPEPETPEVEASMPPQPPPPPPPMPLAREVLR